MQRFAGEIIPAIQFRSLIARMGRLSGFQWEVEALTQMIDERVDQVTIAATLPNRNWHAIRLKAYEIIGARNFHISLKPIRDEEKYEDYLVRLERDGEKANRTSGNRWTNGRT